MLIINSNNRITKRTIESISALAAEQNGRRRARTIDDHEVAEFVHLLRKHRRDENTKIIRVYSADGFVPSSYKWPAPITRLIAERHNEAWHVRADTADASRPHGAGALITINNRAA